MKSTIDFIKSKLADSSFTPDIGLILGSGLGDIAKDINGVSIPYSEIPNFKQSSVEGHAGNLIVGELCNKKVIAMQGRFHFYEGHTLQENTYPVRIMKLLGINKLIVTNAAGAINMDFNPGDLMFINDHLNLMGTNPLIGPNIDELGSRFVDMTYAYCPELLKTAQEIANNLNIKTQLGVYAGLSGPTYETKAEVRMLRTLGADAVGMSTVPEVIVANHMKLKVIGISCLTNMAAGILDQPLSHAEVIETSNKVKSNFIKLVKEIVKAI